MNRTMNVDWKQLSLLILFTILSSFMLSSLYHSSRLVSVVSPKLVSASAATSWFGQYRSHHCEVKAADYEIIKAQAEAMLRQKHAVLSMLKDSDYTQKIPAVYNSSVGGHIRHSLDHFQAIVKATKSDNKLADYDTRKRNTEVESNRQAALQVVQDLLNTLPTLSPNEAISVSFIGNDTTFTTFQMPSYVSRELSFASHHAIHHMSMVKLVMQAMHYDFPKDSGIGIAPSTAKEIKTNGSQ